MASRTKTKEQLAQEGNLLKNKMRRLEKAGGSRGISGRGKRKERFQILVETIPDVIYELDAKGVFTFVSRSIENLGYTPKELIGKHFQEIIHPDDLQRVSRQVILKQLKGANTGDVASPKLFDERRTTTRMTKHLETKLLLKNKKANSDDDRFFEIHVSLHSSGKWGTTSVAGRKKFLGSIGIIRDITEHKKIEQEREELIAELKEALAKVKKLKGLLPICASCRKVRDDAGYWQKLETYICEHAEVDFSHGICPECIKKLYPKLAKKKQG
ncbi:MAG: PAS domain S-box protein [Candidatus Omnitrophica bacterium]|nr:PAS domain S-box protein [Candidatus Omnitrophota bacterium]